MSNDRGSVVDRQISVLITISAAMKKWKFGIVGTGMISDVHAKAIRSLENTEFVGVYGSNPVKTQALSDKYQCKAFSSLEEMLGSDIDVLIIATPSGAHMEPAIAAAKNKKHVLCEKPLEISTDRMNKMIAAHADAGTYLGGIFNFRYNDIIKDLHEAIKAERFGKITYASIRVPWWRNEEYYNNSWHGTWKLDGGGALMNQSIHMIDILQHLMGPIKSLQGYTATLKHAIEAEDTATAILKFENGALGTIYGSTTSFPGQFRTLEISGSEGTVIKVENSFKMWQFAQASERDNEIKEKYMKIEGGGGISDPKQISFEPHARNIAAFIAAIEAKLPFEINGTEAKKAVEIVHAIYNSAKEQKHFVF
jgi:UDP-N-acetyl-2-amino-2-deoxyglucuronate dehydrogenase